MVGENAGPDLHRPVLTSGMPLLERVEMRALARRRRGGAGLGGGDGLGHRRQVRDVADQHRQIALEHMAHDETWIGLERVGDAIGGVEAIAEIAVDRDVEGLDRRRAGGGDVQAPRVAKDRHPRYLGLSAACLLKAILSRKASSSAERTKVR